MINHVLIFVPFPLIHRIGDDAVLDAVNTGRKALAVSVYREPKLFCVQVLLDTVEILSSPFICLTVTYKVVILKTGRTRSITIS